MENVLLPEIDDTPYTALEELESEEAVRSPGLGKRVRSPPELPIPACGPIGTAVLRCCGAANFLTIPIGYFQGCLLPLVLWPHWPRKAKDATRK